MTEAETILKMIEAVDPADAKKLDEIDCRTYCYIETPNCEFVGMDYGRKYIYAFRSGTRTGRSSDFREVPYYSRSRDALKTARPKEWFFYLDNFGNTDEVPFFIFECSKGIQPPDRRIQSDSCATEELAELHAIIQAVEYERHSSDASQGC